MSVQIETVVFKKGIGIEKRTPGGVSFFMRKRKRDRQRKRRKMLTVLLLSAITFYSFTFLVNDSTI